MKIDTHQHFWKYNAGEYGWMDGRMESIKRDFLPPDLEPWLRETGIDGTIAVQARQTPEESGWMLELAARFPFIKGVVGWVDLRSPGVAEQLEKLAENPRFVGVRHVLHDEPDDRYMMREDFRRGVAQLASFDLTYDLLLFPRHLPAAVEFVRLFPNQLFVLDHIAKPFIKKGEMEPWARDLRRLAEFENVFCKISGMVTEAEWNQWSPSDFTPYLDVVLESFGTHRVMVGSDWPVATLAATYAEVMGVASDYLAKLSGSERAAVWWNNAKNFYIFPA
ncbi:MAG: amidohydrolase family protein [Terriglobia bacterium]